MGAIAAATCSYGEREDGMPADAYATWYGTLVTTIPG